MPHIPLWFEVVYFIILLYYYFYYFILPDEEIGGEKGMSQFVKMDDFKSMNVGFALDEGTFKCMHAYNVYWMN